MAHSEAEFWCFAALAYLMGHIHHAGYFILGQPNIIAEMRRRWKRGGSSDAEQG